MSRTTFSADMSLGEGSNFLLRWSGLCHFLPGGWTNCPSRSRRGSAQDTSARLQSSAQRTRSRGRIEETQLGTRSYYGRKVSSAGKLGDGFIAAARGTIEGAAGAMMKESGLRSGIQNG
jgi:hypothetical protein